MEIDDAVDWAFRVKEIREELKDKEGADVIVSKQNEYGAVEYLILDYRELRDVSELELVASCTPFARTSWNSEGHLAFTVTPIGVLAQEAIENHSIEGSGPEPRSYRAK